jgi:ribonucleoside-diphosphate reductase alpha chain
MEEEQEYVIKRDGRKELVDLNKIKTRLENLKHRVENFIGKQLQINVAKLARLTISRMRNNVTTTELDEIAADTSSFISDSACYQSFAGNILASNLESNTRFSFKEYLHIAFHNIVNNQPSPLISEELYVIGNKYADQIEDRIVNDRNMLFDYFGMQTLIKGKYLLFQYKNNNQIVIIEQPQHMYMRVCLGIWGDNLKEAFELYEVLSQHYAIMASPTMFHAGTNFPQLSSCFLLDMKEDSISGIFDTIKQTAQISKHAGGVGLAIHKIRCAGSHIASTNGTSNGIVPLLRVFNTTAQYVDQGGGRRKGSFAIYISMYHADIYDFLDLKKNNGAEDLRARDLFLGLWISDLFMSRVILEFEKNSESDPVMWSLFDPNVALGFDEIYGEEFQLAYEILEAEKKYVKQVPIRELWFKVLEAIIETGIPYILFKDHCNEKSNQKNLGCLKSSNLCTEILEFTSPEEVAVCNLASLSLPRFLNSFGIFDDWKLYEVTRTMTRALNRVIDVNYYVIPEARLSNMRHRPIGLGLQGEGTLFLKMRVPFDSEKARKTNLEIAETMYFAALTESHDLAVKYGCYPSMYENSGAPISKGILQQDMWKNAKPVSKDLDWDWDGLREDIKKDGARNSLCITHMPTASTSNILGNTECFEPPYTFLFTRKTKHGEFLVLNNELVTQLTDLGLWKTIVDPITNRESNPMRDKLIKEDGSIQNIPGIPQHIKDIFRTVWEIPLLNLTDMLVDRSQYIDQSSSVNVHYKNSNDMMPKMTQYLCYAWKKGLKTASYYTRTRQQKMVITEQSTSKPKTSKVECKDEVCTSCSA